ncbi:DUF4153 domain-containing protein [Streptomyces sp. NBC_00338]|uniref:DUF4153 domain-containing protein n=1 Tax=Streptomyces sp. NBC_00338 TaxID=2975715 RepID=UPI00225C0053|nr:DUF4173 domain-containing protein [Streptomyces sp. NBC_00338]MCX5143393.1 DUF4173 domain-containing protein [Streptomyces sp. NBC_00338]
MSDHTAEPSRPENGSDPATAEPAAAEVPPPRDTAQQTMPAGVPEPPKVPSYAQQARPTRADPWGQGRTAPKELSLLRPARPGDIPVATLWSVLATGLLSALLLGDGIGLNLLLVALPAALAAYFAARSAARRLRPWTAVWAVGGLALLVVPALRDAGWPSFLAIVSAFALGSLALHGSRSWLGVFLGSLGLLTSVAESLGWAVRGLRDRMAGSRGRWGVVVRSGAVAIVLLIVFGALFASADAAFADVLGDLIPDVSIGDGPWRLFLAVLGLVGALAAAYTAAAPVRWDQLPVRPGKARGRLEWALPLIVLNLLFAGFLAIQLTVLLGGYDKVMAETDLSYSQYAREGFWQLLWATLLTLLVIALALRWAPRGGARDRTLVHGVLGTLCLLTLVVVASALRRMDLYVDAYGLTRLRISVAAVELWLGAVLVLIMAAGVFGARLLPRAVAASAAAGVLAFGLLSPDGLIAEQNVQRYRSDHSIDIEYLQGLSADAVPALDTLPEPLRSCALEEIQRTLRSSDEPWYATSWGESRARDILGDWDPGARTRDCRGLGSGDNGSERGGSDDQYDPYDPY